VRSSSDVFLFLEFTPSDYETIVVAAVAAVVSSFPPDPQNCRSETKAIGLACNSGIAYKFPKA